MSCRRVARHQMMWYNHTNWTMTCRSEVTFRPFQLPQAGSSLFSISGSICLHVGLDVGRDVGLEVCCLPPQPGWTPISMKTKTNGNSISLSMHTSIARRSSIWLPSVYNSMNAHTKTHTCLVVCSRGPTGNITSSQLYSFTTLQLYNFTTSLALPNSPSPSDVRPSAILYRVCWTDLSFHGPLSQPLTTSAQLF
ncbi:unnamed protein product [Protopolystoma xenopodis]|uniref:Uncharacterized protein n=1 Tax=Protopolystoma xenopodis TaxID=117903 RepID=A0A3S5AQU3_9PLAT|nr:unnamed protein product [Protopolystoma xenopodis]